MLKVIHNAKLGRRKGWNWNATMWYILKRLAQKTHLFHKQAVMCFVKSALKPYFRKAADGSLYFDFNGAKMPIVDFNKNYVEYEVLATSVFDDTFTVPCKYNDNHTKEIVEKVLADIPEGEGPYGYTDGKFDVTVKENDVVLDAGAWFGDFSAYVASKKAMCYAFEPIQKVYKILQATAQTNNTTDIYIRTICQGLSDRKGRLKFEEDVVYSTAGKAVGEADESDETGIDVTTIDDFVRENNLSRVDFIKADIEGAERDMLRGARETLQRFAPKLAICTYHLPDDPQVLEQIIKEANPDYMVVHLPKKLMAMVVK